MPSAIHEALVLLFQSNPGLAAILLGEVLGIELPPYADVRDASSSFSEMKPPEYRADTVVQLVDESGKPALSVIVEVQLAVKEKKRRDWLAYTASAERQLGRDACVLVVTPDAAVARWAQKPTSFGLVSTFTPLVIGPEQVPLLTDPEEAKRRPFLAVLSAVAHGQDELEQAIAAASLARDAIVPLADGDVYFDLIKATLSEAARKAFEMLPATYEYQDESLRRSFHKGQESGRMEGRTEGIAHSVVLLLRARGIELSPENEARIVACHDAEQLDRMLIKAASLQSVAELFE